ncbi:MAG: SagB/ThcOx family dehydrogenase [Pegethrix bostrychoides GSE-TBD4-15B]|jgi:SagB-type dehydrogenase family enzyme|uniref:SagB/ThcOx family dehydrogenase n=1 Tax=Pegethrix bostrychoides GSE-TBD4-15B TaxID=2839662 RepID=A0A951PGI8_9CYAN|nr:SagB/ThcOx family dehydrogenase [Pegethrix bostrychoides GSE-TBD4-15B]
MPDFPSIAQHYHERTKYHPQMMSNQDLDWAKQPLPFKDYPIGASFDLKAYLTTEPSPDDKEQEWQRLSRLLFCTYGVTVRISTMNGEPVYLRSAPSAGGLYPVEVYLISRGTPLLPAGLYSYQPQTHSLMHFWDSDLWAQLQRACFWHPTLDDTQLALVTTAVFYRSAWRYQDRAYRRVHLDTGHLLGNLELACAINDYRPHLIGGFMDEAINRLLYLDAEQESALSVVGLANLLELRQNLSLRPTALASKTQIDYPEIPDGELLGYLHQATAIPEIPNPPALRSLVAERRDQVVPQTDKYNFPFCLKLPTAAPPIDWGEGLIELEKTIIRRRSTRAYSGETLSLEELKALLDFTYQPQNYIEQGLDRSPDYFDLGLIETFIAVSGVDGLEEGCYYYAPRSQELRQIRFKNFRQELHMLCLQQNLGRDAGAVLFHTADLDKAIAQYGDRAYRYLHMDAGHLGQRLNLAAIQLGLGVSGIAGFFDDAVNEVLGIPADEAVLYITTLGQPKSGV